MSTKHCQVCRKDCRPFRCTKCRNAFYCSVDCQKVDWKAGHRRTCKGPPKEKINDTLKELFSIAQGVPIQEAQEHYHKAQDEVERQTTQQKEAKQSDNSNSKKQVPASENIGNNGHSPTTIVTKNITPLQAFSKSTFCPTSVPVTDHFSLIAEEMGHISRFHMTLRRKPNQHVELTDLYLSTSRIDGSHSLITLKQRSDQVTVFSAELPRLLDADECALQVEDESTMQLRLSYEEDPCGNDLGLPESLATVEVINMIKCRYCDQPLLSSRPIQRAIQLPSGHWEDIADYLICYSGQAIVDFSSSSASAEPSVALQDSNVVCLHQKDIGVSACVLAVTGYGEVEETNEDDEKGMDMKDAAATVRGDRSWRDVTGGAAVCCSQCCSPLGFAAIESPECFRLFKHRLSVSSGTNGSNRLSSCASFLAREMARYAEAKAMFNFVVALDEPSQMHKKCLLLRLVSWDTNMATSYQTSSRRLDFRRVAKIVFEETYDKLAGNQGSDVTKWVWGGVDLCCAPLNGMPSDPNEDSMMKVSIVRLLLQQDEYDEVLESFREGSNQFSKDVAEATILVKMGTSNNSLGLTAIPLDS